MGASKRARSAGHCPDPRGALCLGRGTSLERQRHGGSGRAHGVVRRCREELCRRGGPGVVLRPHARAPGPRPEAAAAELQPARAHAAEVCGGEAVKNVRGGRGGVMSDAVLLCERHVCCDFVSDVCGVLACVDSQRLGR
eukprot:2488516-Rhodomonas_salina.1